MSRSAPVVRSGRHGLLSASAPDRFGQCVAVGGGLVDLEPGQACKLVYPECGAPCFGNYCD